MSTKSPTHPAVDRRLLLRGGAVLAGAAGATVIGAALGPATAQAADGDPVKVGQEHTGTTTTSLGITGSDAALSLRNTGGPALHLNALASDFAGELVPGDIVATAEGPLVGVDFLGTETTILATGKDLDSLPLPIPTPPTRLLDTRLRTSREAAILGRSADAIDAQGRLTKGSWIDVAVGPSDQEFILSAAFLNAAVIDPVANGYLTVYPPGDRPTASTINFTKGINVSNAAFVGLDATSQEAYIVRIHSSKTTHVLLDLSGAVVAISPYGGEVPAAKKLSSRRASRQDKRAAQLRKSLHATA